MRGKRQPQVRLTFGLYENGKFVRRDTIAHDLINVGRDPKSHLFVDDPMAALASRTASFNEYLHNPPWGPEWIVQQAREHRITGALVLRPRRMKPAATGRLFIERALEEAGIPTLPIEADVIDARAWDPVAARAAVRSFLDTRVMS